MVSTRRTERNGSGDIMKRELKAIDVDNTMFEDSSIPNKSDTRCTFRLFICITTPAHNKKID